MQLISNAPRLSQNRLPDGESNPATGAGAPQNVVPMRGPVPTEASQEIHLWPATLRPAPGDTAQPPPLRLPFAPTVLGWSTDALAPAPAAAGQAAASGVEVEPFFNSRNQLRLLARFPAAADPQVNGVPASRWVVLVPGDFFQWTPGVGYHLVLFNKPRIGAPIPALRGKPCPVCRVPFVATATCVLCLCGIALHCETNAKDGLQCAQLRRECPACQRPIVLTEGYLDPPLHDD